MESGVEGQPKSVAEHVRINNELMLIKSSREGDREFVNFESDAKQTYGTWAKISNSIAAHFPNVPLPPTRDSPLGIGTAKGWSDMCVRLKTATDKKLHDIQTNRYLREMGRIDGDKGRSYKAAFDAVRDVMPPSDGGDQLPRRGNHFRPRADPQGH